MSTGNFTSHRTILINLEPDPDGAPLSELFRTRFCPKRGFEGTQPRLSRYLTTPTMEDNMLKGIALWAMGVPVVVIILLYMFVF